MIKKFTIIFVSFLGVLIISAPTSVFAQNINPSPTFTDAEIEEFRLQYESTNNFITYKKYLNAISKNIESLSKIQNPSLEQLRKLALLEYLKPIIENEYNNLQDRKGDIAFGMFQVLNTAGDMENPFPALPRSVFRKDYEFIPPKFLRRGVSWDAVQEEVNGQIITNEQVFNDLERFQDSGYTILPNIRANAKWAVETYRTTPSSGVCSGRTKDMTDQWNSLHGYSKTYYDFISIFAKRFKDKLDVVTIENEMNAAKQTWCAGDSPEDYLKILLTAQKAFRDNDPKVLVSDGGLTGNVWFWLMMEDKYEKAKKIAGVAQRKIEYDLIAKLASQQLGTPKTIAEVVRYFAFLKKTKLDGTYNAPAYMLGLKYIALARSNNYSRAVNFHYYGHSDGLPYVIAYMRKILSGNKILVSNEMGTQFPESGSFSEEELAGEMLKKFAIMRGSNIVHPNWYTSPRFTIEAGGGVGIYHKGSFLSPDDYISPRPQIIRAANIIQKYLDRPTVSRSRNLITKSTRYTFTDTNEIVSVVWGAALYPFSSSCYVYSTLGEILYSPSNNQSSDTHTLQLSSAMPYYEVCANQSNGGSFFTPLLKFLPGIALFGLK